MSAKWNQRIGAAPGLTTRALNDVYCLHTGYDGFGYTAKSVKTRLFVDPAWSILTIVYRNFGYDATYFGYTDVSCMFLAVDLRGGLESTCSWPVHLRVHSCNVWSDSISSEARTLYTEIEERQILQCCTQINAEHCRCGTTPSLPRCKKLPIFVTVSSPRHRKLPHNLRKRPSYYSSRFEEVYK